MRGARTGFTSKDKLRIVLAALTVIPLITVLILGAGGSSPEIVAIVTGIGIVAAGYSLAWGTEALQFIVPQLLALALLAVLQVLPEYSIEAILSFHGAYDSTILHYATASLTGANRLLLGLGWPSVVIISLLASRRRGRGGPTFVKMDTDQSSSVLFLAVSTLYSFVIVLKASLTVIDAGILVAIYASYVYVARKTRIVDARELESADGPSGAISQLTRGRRFFAIGGLLALGCFIIFVGSSPFVNSILELGRRFKVDEYLLIQWLAPFLTEFPEGITAAYWSARARLAPLAMANLISSKVNQWTLLMATIPLAYTLALGRFQPIQLTGEQVEEILLTASQSLFGAICIFDLKLDVREAVLLLALFLVQFFVPPLRMTVTVAYLVLSASELARTYRQIEIFSNVRRILKS